MKISCGMLVATAVMMAAAPAAIAQAPAAPPTGPAYMVTYLDIMPSAKGDAASLLKQVAAASRKEPGNQRYDVLQRIDRTNQFAILETWTDLKAAEAHAGGPALKEFKEKLKPLQVSFYDERLSNSVAVAPGVGPASKGAIFAITHVDVIPPKREECVEMLKKLAEETRKEPGSERFEAWVQNNRGNHFTVTETWKSIAGVDAHIVAPATREFRDKLGTMTGALYDERLYTSIE
jgi:quinol monooxygenase YgiN